MFKDMVLRIENAHNKFNEQVMEVLNCTEQEANLIKDVYLKNKIAKCDANIGRIHVKHGAFWEKDVLNRALEHAKQ